jgi:hypothetical protein
MPKVKDRSALMKETLEERYELALKGLDDGIFKSLQKAAEAYELGKSSLGHRRNGCRSRQEAHQKYQIFSRAADKAIVRWIIKLDDFGMPPRLNYFMDSVMAMAKEEQFPQVEVRNFPQVKNPAQLHLIGKNWITRFLNHHSELASKFASRIDSQRAYASNPHTIKDHYRKLGRVIREEGIEAKDFTNVDEKGFVMGISPRTKVVTRKGRKNPRSKQDGKQEFITAPEAVSADGFVFPSFLIAKGAVQCFDWYKNVHADDKDAHFEVSKKGWTDDTMAMHWLTEVYDPISRVRCSGRKHLLILDGHASRINYIFLSYCEVNNIIIFCLPAYSTNLLQPLDVGLFGPLQLAYRKAVEEYFLSTSCGINRDRFFPLYKHARMKAYTKHNIQAACKVSGIVIFNPRAVLSQLQLPSGSPPSHQVSAQILEQTPYTRHDLCQHTTYALTFAKTATEGQICNWILRFAHAAEHSLTQMDLAQTQLQRLQEQIKKIGPSKKDMRQFSKIQRAAVMTGEAILAGLK